MHLITGCGFTGVRKKKATTDWRVDHDIRAETLPFDPQRIQSLSERLLISHYENNYGGAVRRLNSISEQPTNLDYGFKVE